MSQPKSLVTPAKAHLRVRIIAHPNASFFNTSHFDKRLKNTAHTTKKWQLKSLQQLNNQLNNQHWKQVRNTAESKLKQQKPMNSVERTCNVCWTRVMGCMSIHSVPYIRFRSCKRVPIHLSSPKRLAFLSPLIGLIPSLGTGGGDVSWVLVL